MNILSDFYNIDVVNDEYCFDEEGVYCQVSGSYFYVQNIRG